MTALYNYKSSFTLHYTSFGQAMGVVCLRRRLISSLTAFTFLFFVLTQLGSGLQEREEWSLERELSQKRQAGPGSSPPTCRSKCGKCLPCKPVHVPIQPGLSMPLEYYPEAWRCKCGNKLFMP